MSHYKNILLVEDDIDDQEFFVESLREIDPTVSCSIASNGHKALQLLPTLPQPPDLIFLDLNMPVMGGIEFLRLTNTDRMYMAYKNIPVIILTTSSNDDKKCYELGACVYITKPNSSQAFKSILSEVLNSDVATECGTLRSLLAPKQVI